jgi:autotransporter-associated beta strand protein
VALLPTALTAAEFTWTNLNNGAWNTAANWVGGVPVSAADTVLRFTNSGTATYNATNNLASPFQLNRLIFDSTSTGLIRLAGANQLSFVSSGGVAPLILQNGTGGVVISNALTANTNLTFAGSGSGAMTVAGVISGANVNLIHNGPYTLTLTGNNTFGGTNRWVMVNGGTLSVNNTARLGSTTNRIMISSNAILQFTAGMTQIRALSLGTGGGRIEVTGANIVTQTGAFTNNANDFTKLGTGTLVLTAASGRTGRTTNAAGLLQLNSATALGVNATSRVVRITGGTVAHNNATASAATYELDGGTLGVTLNGTVDNERRYSGRIEVLPGGGTISIADARSLTNSVLTHINGLLTGSGALHITGGLATRGNLFLTNLGNTYAGTMTVHSNVNLIAAHTNGSTLGTATVVLNNGATLSLQAGTTNLLVTNRNMEFFYSNNVVVHGDSTLDVRRPVNIGAVVSNTMVLQGLAISNATLTFSSGNNFAARFTGPVTLEGAAAVSVSNGIASLNGAFSEGLVPASFTKTGAGTLFLTNVANRTYSGGTVIQQGILTVHINSTNPTPLGTGDITLAGGTLRTRIGTTATNLVIGPGAGYSLTVTAPSTLQVGTIPGFPDNQFHDFNALTLGAPQFTISQSNGHDVRFSGPVTLTSNATLNIGTDVVFNGPVTDSGAGWGFTKLGTGSLIFTNHLSQDFSGPVRVNQGTLRVVLTPTLTNGLGAHPYIYIGSNATFELRTRDANAAFQRAAGNLYELVAPIENALSRVRVARESGAGTGFGITVGNLTLTNGVRFVITNANNYRLIVAGTTTLGKGVVFDNSATPTGGAFTFELQGPILESAPGARFSKSGFAQPIAYTGTSIPAFTGGTYNDAGLLAWRASGLTPGTYRFGTGAIQLDRGAAFGFQNNVTGGYTLENDLIIRGALSGDGRTNYGGVLDFVRVANNPQVTNSGTLRLRAPLSVTAGTAGSGTPVTFAGPVSLESENAGITVNGSGAGSARRILVTGPVMDDGRPRNLNLIANNAAVLSFNGDNRAFAGDFLIEQGYLGNSGRIRFDTTNALPGGKVRAASETVTVLGFNLGAAGVANVFNRFQFASNAILALEQNNTAALDLPALGQDVRLGASEGLTVTQSGVITPFNNTYKLGGGAGTLNITSANALRDDLSPRRLDAHPNPYAALSGGPAPGTISITASNSYTGGTVVNSGILSISTGRANTPLGTGPVYTYGILRATGGSGSFADAAGTGNNNLIQSYPGAEIRFDNAGGLNTNRWGDAAGLDLNGSLLNLIGVDAASRSFERVGAITFAGGSQLAMTGSTNTLGASALLSAAGLARVGTGTLQITRAVGAGEVRHNLGESNRVEIDGGLPLVNGMVAPYVVNGTDHQFLTYGATGLSNAPATAVNLNTAGASDIVHAGATTLGTDPTVHALRLTGNLSAGAGTSVTLGSGGLIFANTVTNTGVTFRFGPSGTGEGLIYVASGANAVLNGGVLQADGGLTKFGEGTLSLLSPQVSYGSGWNINRGTLTLGTGSGGSGLGTATAGNVVNLNGGVTLNLAATNNGLVHNSGLLTSRQSNSITANFGAAGRFQSFAPLGLRLESAGGPLESFLRVALSQQRAVLNVAGATTLATNAALAVQNVSVVSGSSNRLVLAGGLAGTNRTLFKRGNGTLALPGNNSTTFLGGRTHVEHGVLAVGHNGSLGNGASAATIAPGAVLQIDGSAIGYTSTAPIQFAPGSAERWTHERARFGDFTTPQTFTLPNGVSLQLMASMTNFSDKVIQLQGGTIEAYLHADDSRTNNLVVVSGVDLELLADGKLGQSGIDHGRGGMVLDFRGNITDDGNNRSLTKIGAGTVVLSGPSISYGGATHIDAGVLLLGRSEVLPDSTSLHIGANGTLDLNGFDETVGNLSGSGRILSPAGVPNALNIDLSVDSIFNGSFEGGTEIFRGGSATLYLGGASTGTGTFVMFDGATVVTAGPDLVTGGTPLGDPNEGTVLLTGAAKLLSAGPVEVARDIRVDGLLAGEKVLGGATAHESTFSSGISLFDHVSLTATNGGRVNFTGQIVDISTPRAVTKTGAGVVNLTGPNFWNAGTTVAEGTLLVNNGLNGSATGLGDVTVEAGATLGGAGRIAGNVSLAAGASLQPGNSAGTLRIDQNLSFAALASITFEIGGLLKGVEHDHVSVGGNVSFAGSVQLSLDSGYYPAGADSFELASFASRSGTFDNAANGARINTTDNLGSFQINYNATNVIASAFQFTDSDLDGIYDAWALKHFGLISLPNGTGPTDRFGDFDGDERSNFAEFIAGTIPTNAASFHAIITAALSGTHNFAVRFTLADETTFRSPVYRIQFTEDLTPPVVWTTVPVPVLTFPAPGVAEWIDDGSQTGGTAPLALPGNRFYRVLIE